MLSAGTVRVPTTPTSKGVLMSNRKVYSNCLHQQGDCGTAEQDTLVKEQKIALV